VSPPVNAQPNGSRIKLAAETMKRQGRTLPPDDIDDLEDPPLSAVQFRYLESN
jgi:hypothetical protein